MDIVGLIEWCVVLVIIILYLTLFWFILGFSPSASFERLPPTSATSKISRIFRTGCTYVFTAIIIAVTVIWLVWHMLKFISPFILGFGDLIVAIVPPFPQLEDAGIFKLWDDMSGSVVTFNIRGVFRALGRFYRTSGQYIFAKFTGVSVSQRSAAISKDVKTLQTEGGGQPPAKTASAPSNSTPSGEEDDEPMIRAYDDEEVDDETSYPDATEESKYTAHEHKAVQDRIDMCIAEKTIPIRDDMSPNEKVKATYNNNNVSITCRAQSIGHFSSIKGYS